ncbi:MAG: ribonuclease HI [Vulcanisaeta sp. AZ3]
MRHCTLYFDGACEPVNPGGVGTYGFVIYEEDSVIHRQGGIACEPGPNCTNNVAEYTGLINGLRWILNHPKLGCDWLLVIGDSQLVIRHVLGRYRVRSERLKPLYDGVVEILRDLRSRVEVKFRWVRRELNEEADELTKEAYVKYMDEHPEAVEKFRNYFATEDQLKTLTSLGVKIYRYMGRFEAERLIKRLGG